MAISDRIAVMQDGVILQEAAPHEIYADPVNIFVAGFIGKSSVLDCAVTEINADNVKFASGLLTLFCRRRAAPRQLRLGDRLDVMIRPEDIHLGAPPSDGAPVVLKATVRDKVFLGSAWRVYAALPSGQEIAAHAASGDAVDHVAKGGAIELWWPRDRGRVLAQ